MIPPPSYLAAIFYLLCLTSVGGREAEVGRKEGQRTYIFSGFFSPLKSALEKETIYSSACVLVFIINASFLFTLLLCFLLLFTNWVPSRGVTRPKWPILCVFLRLILIHQGLRDWRESSYPVVMAMPLPSLFLNNWSQKSTGFPN